MTFLTLVRHGTTDWIEQGRLHGVMDSSLSPRGRQESRLAAEALAGRHFDAFYTSPLGRACETAGIISQVIGMEPVTLEGLHEMDFGWLEGGHIFKVDKINPLRRTLRSVWVSLVVGLSGEPRPQFGRRVVEAAREIARRHPNQRVLAVTHMAVRNHLLAWLVDGEPKAWNRYNGWPACAFTEIELDPEGRARLIYLNMNEHLSTLRSNS